MSGEWLGTIAATLTTASFLPQAVRTIRTRDTAAISLWMYIAFTVGVGFWFAYGVVLDSWPMMVANTITFALAATILAMKIRHG